MTAQLHLFDRSPEPPAQRHSATSKAAAENIKPARPTLRARVLELIRASGSAGLTDDQIQSLTGMNPSTQRPRRIELQEAGLIRDSGKTRPTRSKRQATVWVAANV